MKKLKLSKNTKSEVKKGKKKNKYKLQKNLNCGKTQRLTKLKGLNPKLHYISNHDRTLIVTDLTKPKF